MSNSVKVQLALARGHLQRGDSAAAEALLAALLEEFPRFADVHNELGLLFHERGDFERAQACFLKALEINPGYIEAALHLAITWNDVGRYDDARRVYAEAVTRARGNPETFDGALARRIAPLYVEIADLYVQAGLHGRSIPAYRAALELCPTFQDVRHRLANVLIETGEPAAAIAELNTILAANPELLGARVSLGLAEYAAGHKDAAAGVWRDVLARDPRNVQAAMYLRLTGSPR